MTIGERIRKARRTLDLTQAEFASRIKSTQNTVTRYETGDRTPSASVITLICREFDVNEKWLRTGEGEMFVKKEPQPLDKLLFELLGGEAVTDEDRVLVKNFLELPDASRKAVIEFVQKCAGELSAPAAISKTETTTPAPPAGTDTPVPTDYETEARAEAEEYYREILEEKRRAAGGSASSASSETKPA